MILVTRLPLTHSILYLEPNWYSELPRLNHISGHACSICALTHARGGVAARVFSFMFTSVAADQASVAWDTERGRIAGGEGRAAAARAPAGSIAAG